MSDLDTEALAAKVEARSLADTVMDLALGEVRQAGLCAPAAEAYWRRLIDRITQLDPSLIPKRVVERGPLAPMTDEESKAFELTTFPFGMHIGRSLYNVPMRYLEWLDGQPDFRRQLNRYLRSERAQREQEDHDDA